MIADDDIYGAIYRQLQKASEPPVPSMIIITADLAHAIVDRYGELTWQTYCRYFGVDSGVDY